MQSAKFARLFEKVSGLTVNVMLWFDFIRDCFWFIRNSYAFICEYNALHIENIRYIYCSPFRMQSARLFVKVSGLSANVMLLFANVSRLFAIDTRLFAKLTRYISKVRVFFGTRVFGKCYCVFDTERHALFRESFM